MPNRLAGLTLLILMLVYGAAACTSTTSLANEIVVEKVAVERFCAIESGVILISSPRQLGRLPRSFVHATNINIDWQQRQILLINMGQQANLGYSINYLTGAKIANDVMTIPVQRNTPEAGRMYAQMLVSPCLILNIPKGGYGQLEIRDQNAKLLWSLETSGQ